ncbi:hypothetical protein DV20_39445 [Amycolatopsis rifamycinica]|uniref:Uncharacterized protein n=1 Tax=Amycolatopsis rifamycinica TaxID=287986 RepID=A0A066TX80_9PSEU|nr:hypothetical protein DV20_39445 [Amycolatopsis rifamycinica]
MKRLDIFQASHGNGRECQAHLFVDNADVFNCGSVVVVLFEGSAVQIEKSSIYEGFVPEFSQLLSQCICSVD